MAWTENLRAGAQQGEGGEVLPCVATEATNKRDQSWSSYNQRVGRAGPGRSKGTGADQLQDPLQDGWLGTGNQQIERQTARQTEEGREGRQESFKKKFASTWQLRNSSAKNHSDAKKRTGWIGAKEGAYEARITYESASWNKISLGRLPRKSEEENVSGGTIGT